MTREEYGADVEALMVSLRPLPFAQVTRTVNAMAERAGLLEREPRKAAFQVLALTVTELRLEKVWPNDER